jgi:hypothetical protein
MHGRGTAWWLVWIGAASLAAGGLGACKKSAKPPERAAGEEDGADAGGGPGKGSPSVTRVVEADGAVLNIVEPSGDANLLHPGDELSPVRAEFSCPGQEAFEPTTPDPQADFDMEDLHALFPDMPQDKVPIEINTESGKIQCEVWPQQAPHAVAIFLGLATGARAWWHPCKHEWVTGRPYYDETAFQNVTPAVKVDAGCLYRGCEAAAGFAANVTEGGAAFDRPGLLVMPRAGTAGPFGVLDCEWRVPEPTKITEGKCEFSADAQALQADWVAFGLCKHEGLMSTIYRLARVAPDRHQDPHALFWLRAVSPTTEYYRYRPGRPETDGGVAPAADGGAAAAPPVAGGSAPAEPAPTTTSAPTPITAGSTVPVPPAPPAVLE